MSNIIFSLLILCCSVPVRNTVETSDPDTGQTRLRLALKSCDFVDLSVAGMICGGGKKIKYFKEKTKPRPKHTIFWDAITGHTILAVHSGKQWACCSSDER